MDLILWRHAEAHDAREGQDDLERALTGKGERQAARMADWLGRQLPASARVLSSLLAAALQRVASDRAGHAARLIVELPGLRDAQGRSPFWEGLGRHFYDGDPAAAAARFGPDWCSHVAALLPRQPVYTDFLCDAAQAAVAQVDPAARVLMDLLWQAGLRYAHHISIADGGPVFECATDLVVAPVA